MGSYLLRAMPRARRSQPATQGLGNLVPRLPTAQHTPPSRRFTEMTPHGGMNRRERQGGDQGDRTPAQNVRPNTDGRSGSATRRHTLSTDKRYEAGSGPKS
jgi:hypothetical protein